MQYKKKGLVEYEKNTKTNRKEERDLPFVEHFFVWIKLFIHIFFSYGARALWQKELNSCCFTARYSFGVVCGKGTFSVLFQTVKRVYKGAEGTEALKEDLKLNDKDTYGLQSLKFRMLPDGTIQYGSKRHKRVISNEQI